MLGILLFVRKNKDGNILDKVTTKSIEGLFAVFIVFSHMHGYIPFDDFGGEVLNSMIGYVGQACVAPFFFFSGYGILESIKKKGDKYIQKILVNRLLRVWLWFLIALIPYYVIALVTHASYTPLEYALAPFGFTSIGNSNWFVVVILGCYLISGLVFLIKFKNYKTNVLLISALVVTYLILGYCFKLSGWWYDTVLCFPLGLFVSLYKNKISSALDDKAFKIFAPIYIVLFIAVSYLFPHYISSRGSIVHSIMRSLLLCMLITCLSKIVMIKKSPYLFLGGCSFGIYIYQRVPMIILNSAIGSNSHYLFWIPSLLLALGLGIGMTYAYKAFDRLTVNKLCKKLDDKYEKKHSVNSENDSLQPALNSSSEKDVSFLNNDSTNIRVGIIINYLSLAVSIIGSLFVSNRILDYVGDTEYGLYSFVLSITSWLTIITSALNSSFVRFSMLQKQKEGKPDRTNTLYFKLFSLFSLVVLILGLAIVATLDGLHVNISSYDWKISHYLYQMFALSIINVCLMMPAATFSLFITYNKKFIFANSLTLIFNILAFIGHFFLAYYTHQIIWTCVYSIGATSLTWLINYLFCRKELDMHFMKTSLKANKTLLLSIAWFSGIVVLNAIVDQINGQVDKTILGFMGKPIDVTIYQMGATFSSYMSTMSVAVSSPFAPSINEYVAKGDDDKINDIYTKVSRIQLIVVTMVAFGFLACGREFIDLWIGAERERAYYVGSVLLLIDICPLSLNASIEIQRARNKHLFRAIVYFVIALLNVGLSLLFIYLLPEGCEIYGCLIGTVIARILSHWILMNWYNDKKMHLPVKRYLINLTKHIISGAVGAGVGIGIGYLLKENTSMSLLPIFILEGVTFIVVYGIFILFIDKDIVLRAMHKKSVKTTN